MSHLATKFKRSSHHISTKAMQCHKAINWKAHRLFINQNPASSLINRVLAWALIGFKNATNLWAFNVYWVTYFIHNTMLENEKNMMTKVSVPISKKSPRQSILTCDSVTVVLGLYSVSTMWMIPAFKSL